MGYFGEDAIRLSRSLADAGRRLALSVPHGSSFDQASAFLLDTSSSAARLSLHVAAEVLTAEWRSEQELKSAGPFGQLIELGGRLVAPNRPPGCFSCRHSVPGRWQPTLVLDPHAREDLRWLYYLAALALAENAFLWGGADTALVRHGAEAAGDLRQRMLSAEWRQARPALDGPGNRLTELGRYLIAAREALGVCAPDDARAMATELRDATGKASDTFRKGLEPARARTAGNLLREIVDRALARDVALVDLVRIADQLGLLDGAPPPGRGCVRAEALLGARALCEAAFEALDSGESAATSAGRLAHAMAAEGADRDELAVAFARLWPADGPAQRAIGREVARAVAPPRPKRWWGFLAAAAVVATSLVVTLRPEEAVRTKGAPVIVGVRRGTQRFALGEATLAAGDVLSFEVSGDAKVAVAGFEAPDRRRVYFRGPAHGLLPAGVRVDKGVERLVLIRAPGEAELDAVLSSIDPRAPGFFGDAWSAPPGVDTWLVSVEAPDER